MTKQFELASLSRILVAGVLATTAYDSWGASCEKFLCGLGEDAFKNKRVTAELNAKVAKETGTDLFKISDVEYKIEEIEDDDVPAGQQFTTPAVKIEYRLKADAKIKGNDVKKGSKVDIYVIDNDVQLRSIKSDQPFAWGLGDKAPPQQSYRFCLWEPSNIFLIKGQSYKGIDVTEGTANFILYRDHSIKEIRGSMGSSAVRIKNQVLNTEPPIRLKKDGSIFTEKELNAANAEKNKLKKEGKWSAPSLEPYNDICSEARSEVPDQMYKIKRQQLY